MYKAGNSVEQVFGGTVIKQGDQTPFGFMFRNENGELVSLANASVKIKIANKSAFLLEKDATLKDEYTVTFSLGKDDITGSGDMRLEFTVTYADGLQEKFPSDDWQRIRITSTLDDISKTGIAYLTFEQMKADFTQKVDDLNKRVDNLVIEAGNSNPEIAEARENVSGDVYASLKERIDNDYDVLNRKSDIFASTKEKRFDDLKQAITGGFDYAPVINGALNSSTKRIFVPDGEYLLNSSILIPTGKTLLLSEKAILIRNFSGGGSSVATVRNKSLSSTTRDKDICFSGGVIKAADSTKTGKHVVFWGVDNLDIPQIKIRDTYGDWATNLRDCTNTKGDLIDIDTIGADIYTDGLHITGGRDYNFTTLNIKSGDDCLSFTVETPEDTEINGVVIGNANLTTRRSSIIKMTTKVGTTPKIRNVSIKNVKGTGGTIGAGEAIVLKDEDKAGRIENIEIEASADCANGAGVGCRLQGVNRWEANIKIDNPEGKGFDITYCKDFDLKAQVSGQRTDGISAISMGNIDSFSLEPKIDGATLHGIAVGAAGAPVTNGIIKDGRIKNSKGSGVRLINANGVKVKDNIFTGNATPIVEDSGNGSDYNIIKGNDVRNNTSKIITTTGLNTKVRENPGYDTEKRSSFQLNSTATRVTVNHGLSTAPSQHGIEIKFRSSWGAFTKFWFENIGPETFDFVVDQAPGIVVNMSFEANAPRNI
jgi:Glycosyl hydrolases family 28